MAVPAQIKISYPMTDAEMHAVLGRDARLVIADG